MLDFNVLDAGARRAVTDRLLESLDGLDLALGERFDMALGQVAHPPVQSLAPGEPLGEKPETDALHTAGHEIPSGSPQRASYGCCCSVVFGGSGFSGSALIGSIFRRCNS